MYKKRQHICHFVIYSGAKVQLFFDICKGWGQKKNRRKTCICAIFVVYLQAEWQKKAYICIVYLSCMYRI